MMITPGQGRGQQLIAAQLRIILALMQRLLVLFLRQWQQLESTGLCFARLLQTTPC